ncbi:MAG: hypothetical protein EON90_12845, partial [Brevundimonas sp.]
MVDIALPVPGRPYVTLEAGAGERASDVSADLILDLYREHGALLLRGFPFDLDSFSAFTDGFCSSSVFNESPDRLLLDEARNIQSVNGGLKPFPLHPELSREPWKPDVCFFCCLEPPRELGQTTVCDGAEIVRALPAEVRDGLAAHRLIYVQAASPDTLAYWLGTPTPDDARLKAPPAECPYRFVRTPQGIMRVFTRPALHRTMFGDRLAFGNFLLFARYFHGRPNFPILDDGRPVPERWIEAVKSVSDDLTAPIAWRKGDLIMLDNTRFMHGRTAIVEDDTRLIASYFGYLKDAPRNPE